MTRAKLNAIVVATMLCAWGCAEEVPRRRHTVADARAFYETLPSFYRPVTYSEVPKGLKDLRASSCGQCHVEIYREWRISTHARAWRDDPQFLEELKKGTAVKGRDGTWVCMNCHTPVEAQLPRLLVGLKHGDRGLPITIENPAFDPVLQDEAITCATCHVRDGMVYGPYGDTKAPHPVAKSERLLTAEVCTQCHQAEEVIEDLDTACALDTGKSFAAGPDALAGKICQSCHMPALERPLTSQGTAVRMTRRHWFGGSRLAKRPEFTAELAPMLAAFPNGARLEWIDLPTALPPATHARLTFAVTNAEAGHTLPTGDVERFLLLTAEVADSTGRLLATRTERIGTRYQWSPTVEKLADNRLAPRESRRYVLEFDTPARGGVTLRLRGEHHRISQENFDAMMLDGKTVQSREFFRAETRLWVR